MNRFSFVSMLFLTLCVFPADLSAFPLEEFDDGNGDVPNPIRQIGIQPAVDLFQRLVARPEAGRNWGPEQAEGPPNTHQAGDISTAWASLSQDTQEEWLELSYEKAVVPVEVVVYETFNPGAVHKVTVFTPDSKEHVVWEGDDPTKPGVAKGVSRIKIRTDIKSQCIRIYLKSGEVPGWNEIDAVGLVGKETPLQWANAAEASSTFAEQPLQGAFAQEVPAPFNSAQVDQQMRQMVRERERKLARMIKELRERDQQMRRQERRFASEKSHWEEQLKSIRKVVEQLKAENEGLRQQLNRQ